MTETPCPRCGGTGLCRECEGRGAVPCPQCGGSKQTTASVTGKAMRCSRCRGAGSLECPTSCESCVGRGTISTDLQEEMAQRYRPAFQEVTLGGARVTTALVGALFVMHGLLGLLYGPQAMLKAPAGALVSMGCYTPALVAFGEGWRLLTAGFGHHDIIHLAFNASALLSLGRLIEGQIGGSRFWITFVLCVVGGFGADFMLRGADVISMGASGGVFGLLGYGLVAAHRAHDSLQKDYFTRWLAVSVPFTLLMGANHYAHGGGFVVGSALAWLWSVAPPRTPTAERAYQGLAVLLLLLVLVAEGIMLKGLLYGAGAGGGTQP